MSDDWNTPPEIVKRVHDFCFGAMGRVVLL